MGDDRAPESPPAEGTPAEPLRILHTINSFRWTGVAEPAVGLAQQQKLTGHEVTLAVEEGGNLEERGRDAGLEVQTGLMSHHFNPITVLSQLRKFRQYIKNSRPDIVHTHLLHDHWVAALALRGLGGDRPKLVRTFHREEQPRSHPWTKWLARQTDGMIAISSSLGEQLRRTYRRTDGNLTVIGGVVDTEQFHRDEEGGAALRREWEIPEGAKVVGLLSRLREARGIFWLLDAVEPLLERVPGAVVVYCGRGRHAKLLRERIAEHPRKDRVRYPGYMTADQLNAAYSAFDVHCLLGPGNDGTCRAALQSMSCEVPLVAVDQGALHDMLQPQEGEASDAEMGGRLAAKNDVATLVDVLAEILTDGTLRDQMGHVARHRMETYFRPEQQAQAVLRWYNSLLEKR